MANIVVGVGTYWEWPWRFPIEQMDWDGCFTGKEEQVLPILLSVYFLKSLIIVEFYQFPLLIICGEDQMVFLLR